MRNAVHMQQKTRQCSGQPRLVIKFQTNLFGFARNRKFFHPLFHLKIFFWSSIYEPNTKAWALLANPFKHFADSFFAVDWFNLQIESKIRFGKSLNEKDPTQILPLNSDSGVFWDWKCKSQTSIEAHRKRECG